MDTVTDGGSITEDQRRAVRYFGWVLVVAAPVLVIAGIILIVVSSLSGQTMDTDPGNVAGLVAILGGIGAGFAGFVLLGMGDINPACEDDE